MSQLERNLALPSGSNCSVQSAGSATTTTGVRWVASTRAGLTAWLSSMKPGNSASAPRVMPNHITHLRPTLSDSQPNST